MAESDPDDVRRWAGAFRMLGEPSRLRIVLALRHRPLTVKGLCASLGLGRPTLCYHLRLLRLVGLVSGVRQGKCTRYEVSRETLSALAAVLEP